MTKLNEKWLVCFELCFECVVVQHLNSAKATLLFIRFNMFILCPGKNGSLQGESRSFPNMTLQTSQDEIKMRFLKSVLFTYVLALNNIVQFLLLCPTI